MTDTIRTLITGYRRVLRGLLQGVLVLAVLSGVSAGIAFPVWFLATRAPTVFNAVVLLFVVLTLVVALVRRGRTCVPGGGKNAKPKRALVRLVVVVSGLLVLAGIAVQSIILAVAGFALLSGAIAWVQGRT